MAVFEGSEKRLEVVFAPTNKNPFHADKRGCAADLRQLTRTQLDLLLKDAACTIISQKSSVWFDGYVLSESSMFVYEHQFILKTCGTTKLLDSVPRLLKYAKELGLVAVGVRFSRASFLFPESQPLPHSNFQQEIDTLKSHCGALAKDSSAYVLGDHCSGLQWHVFEVGVPDKPRSDVSLEMCMTGLSRASAEKFFRNDSFVSAQRTTEESGIADLLPRADIDDVVFSPCGYSMNGLLGPGFITIHVTPEETCSYASVEFSGFEPDELQIDKLMNQVVKIFAPEQLYVAATVAGYPGVGYMDGNYPPLQAYICRGLTTQTSPSGSRVVFGSFTFQPTSTLWTLPSTLSSENSDEEFEPKLKVLRTDEAMKDKSCVLTALRRRFQVDRIANSSPDGVDSYIRSLVKSRDMEDTFYVFDLSLVRRLFTAWMDMMPRVKPFYAVKCNPDAAMITLLSSLGSGFDCASEEEVQLLLSLGVSPERIIFASACKRPRDIRAAKATGVNLTTFDTKSELQKLKRHYPECNLVLRIRADDPDARCPLGNKYGAEIEEVEGLLTLAKELEMGVIGISFHVGSGGTKAAAFTEAIRLARTCFDQALALGFNMQILDIGGGFSGGQVPKTDLDGVPDAVNRALDIHFPVASGVKIIAEPGRYFAEAAATLATNVYGRRERQDELGNVTRDYWITDGLYGSFNCIPYDHATVVPRVMQMVGGHREREFVSTLFGPTCDGLDTVITNCPLPELEMGDWVVFSNMGAYTLAGASNFNGFNATDVDIFYVWAD
ncbi:hypothetical protein BSKO_09801 [Bryopsis sp. KO-2023]|nr:hypothetical protein BSKO_09801 [Bryopsis sp. KO-2023]